MSKASEWAKALAVFKQQFDDFAGKKPSPFRLILDGPERFIDFGVSDDGEPRVTVNGTRYNPELGEVIGVAYYLIATFGEPTP